MYSKYFSFRSDLASLSYISGVIHAVGLFGGVRFASLIFGALQAGTAELHMLMLL